MLKADRTPVFNTAAVARRTGLSPATFRAWERRYGFPVPQRGPKQQRAYSELEVRALQWLQDRLTEGLTISAAVALLRDHLARTRPVVESSSHPPARFAEDLQNMLLAFDAVGATAVLGEAFALYSVERVCLDVIQPALLAIGDGWHAGVVETAQEHFASAFIRRRLALLLETVGPSGSRVAVAACAPGEWHELGLMVVALFLARRGWRVIYLGADLPPDGLTRSLTHLQPDALVLSATTDATAQALADLATRIANLPSPPVVAFGGQPFESRPDLREAVPGLYLGPTAATAVEQLDQAIPDTRR